MKEQVSSTPEITLTELLKELDKYRSGSKTELTKEQEKFIITCRTGKKLVPQRKMAELWTKLGWGEATRGLIEGKIDLLKKQGKLK